MGVFEVGLHQRGLDGVGGAAIGDGVEVATCLDQPLDHSLVPTFRRGLFQKVSMRGTAGAGGGCEDQNACGQHPVGLNSEEVPAWRTDRQRSLPV